MKRLLFAAILLTLAVGAYADLTPGEPLPDVSLLAPDAKTDVEVRDLLNRITVLHLWKCN